MTGNVHFAARGARSSPQARRKLLTTFLALLVFLASPAFGDWRETLTQKRGTFPALRSFKAHYRFGWVLFPAAEANFDYTRGKSTAKLVVTAKSIGVVRTSWPMDSETVSTMRTATLLPISLIQTETYRDESEKTRVDYTPSGVARLRESKPAHGKPRVKRFAFAEVHDLHSAIHFIRSQRLSDGDIYNIVVYPSTDPYLARIVVANRAPLKVAATNYKAIRMDLKLWKIDKKLQLKPHEKFKRATIFLSDDADRVLLRIEGEVAVGSVWCELDKLEFG
jgi:hypothetical protein